MNTQTQQFQNQDFINVETFYESGKGVKTPVWFAQEGDTLWVRTAAGSYKVQRINATGRVNVAPCDRAGKVLGEWVPGQGAEITDAAAEQRVNGLLNKKYGLQKKLFELMGRVRGDKSTILRIDLAADGSKKGTG
jgi:PPOX class probable F420-dependent enzyme